MREEKVARASQHWVGFQRLREKDMSDIQDIDENSRELYTLINDTAFPNENLVG